jgi:hypothetical protein
MGFFDDFRKAIDNYDGDSMNVNLVGFQLLAPGPHLNVGEWFRFQVQVFNDGQLNLTGVTVLVNSTAFARVNPVPAGPTADSAIVPFGNIGAHSSRQSSQWVLASAILETAGAQDIITARIFTWDADLNHLLNDHSGFGPPEGVINHEVFSN